MWLGMVIILAFGLVASRLERNEWNGGVCKKNGLPWVYFDTDSQGGRGYQAGDQVTWQSWGHDSAALQKGVEG